MSKSYWLQSGLFTLLQRVSALLFGLGSFILLIRFVLTKDEFGIWTLFFALTSLVELGRTGFIKNSLIKFSGQSEDNQLPLINTASLFINIVITLISTVILLLLADFLVNIWHAPDLKKMLYLYVIASTLLIPFSQFEFLQQSGLSFRGVSMSYLTRNGTFLLFIACMVQFNTRSMFNPLHTLVVGQAVSICAGTLVSYLFAKRFIIFSKHLSKNWIHRLFNFGKYTFLTNLSSVIYFNTDQMMLGAMVSQASVAIYNTSLRINNLAQVPSLVMATIVFPQSVARAQAEGIESLKLLYLKSVGAIIAIVIPFMLTVILLSEQIIYVIAGSEYLEAVPILQVTILYVAFVPFNRQFGVMLESMGRPGLNSSIETFNVALNIIFNYLFILKYGILGAAYGTLAAGVFRFCVNFVLLRRLAELNPLHSFYYVRPFYRVAFNLLIKYFDRKFK